MQTTLLIITLILSIIHIVMTSNHALEHAFVGIMVTATSITIALCCCEEQCQITGMAGLKETSLQSSVQCLGHTAGNEAAGGNRHAVLNHQGSFCCSNNRFLSHNLIPLQFFLRNRSGWRDASPGMRSCLPSCRRWRKPDRSWWLPYPDRCPDRCPYRSRCTS